MVEPRDGRASAGAQAWEAPASRPSYRAAIACAAMLLVVVASVLALRSDGEDTLAVDDAARPDGTATFGEHEPIPEAPDGGRAGVVSAWSGDEWLLWGGVDGAGDVMADGLAYDPAADRWRTLPEAPLAPRQGAAAVWAGDRLVVWGGIGPDGSVLDDGAWYRPAEDRWERLPPGPLQARFAGLALAAGGEVVFLGGQTAMPGPGEGRAPVARDVAALDIGSGSWRELAPLPDDAAAAPGVLFVAVGDRAVAWQRERGWVYAPEQDRWEPTPPPPPELRVHASAKPVALRGREALIVGARKLGQDRGLGVVLDLDGGWGGTAGEGIAVSEPWYVRTTGDERVLVVLPDGPASFSRATVPAAVWDIHGDRWLPIPREVAGERMGYTALWTGEELLVWGGTTLAGTGREEGRLLGDGMRWRLARGDAAAWGAWQAPELVSAGGR